MVSFCWFVRDVISWIAPLVQKNNYAPRSHTKPKHFPVELDPTLDAD